MEVSPFPVEIFNFLFVLVVEFFSVENFSGNLWYSVHKHFILFFSDIEWFFGRNELVSKLVDFFFEPSSLSNGYVELFFAKLSFIIKFSIFMIEGTFVVGLSYEIVLSSPQLMLFFVDLCPYHFLLAFWFLNHDLLLLDRLLKLIDFIFEFRGFVECRVFLFF